MENTKTNFLEYSPGNRSNSRLIVLIIVCAALVETFLILYFGREDIVQAATAAGLLFTTLTAPPLAFLFGQKRNETKAEQNKLSSSIKNQ